MGQNIRGVGHVPCPSLREASSSARHDRFPWKPLGPLGRLSAAAMEACCPLGDGPHYERGRPWASSSRPRPRPTPSWRLSLSCLPLRHQAWCRALYREEEIQHETFPKLQLPSAYPLIHPHVVTSAGSVCVHPCTAVLLMPVFCSPSPLVSLFISSLKYKPWLCP